ncbi:MAG: hypothetical protein Q4B64_04155 [Spirochaetales bacterium]|nr:hypothetical protein [Spirochaetales bacterium]
MKAIVPHKDTLFFLAGVQRKLISMLAKEKNVYPQYPLYAFTEDEIPSGVMSLTIGCPGTENELAVFPLLIEGEGFIINLKIPFARTADRTDMPELKMSEEIKNAFPRKERIFRTATVIRTENSWQLFDDRWNKIKK